MSTMRMFMRLPSFGRAISRRFLAAEAAKSADKEGMKFTFACPATVYYHEAAVKQIDVPSWSGSFGILPSHVPTVAVLKAGVVTVYEEDGSTNKIFVSSGSVSVNNDGSVQILAEEALPLTDLDAEAARKVINEAHSEISSSDEKLRAEAQIKTEVAEALIAAAGEAK